MLSTCAKVVDYLRTRHGKYGAFLSPKTNLRATEATDGRAKPVVIPMFTPTFPLHLSPPKIAISPLIEHYFYPVSTAPIIRATNEI